MGTPLIILQHIINWAARLVTRAAPSPLPRAEDDKERARVDAAIARLQKQRNKAALMPDLPTDPPAEPWPE